MTKSRRTLTGRASRLESCDATTSAQEAGRSGAGEQVGLHVNTVGSTSRRLVAEGMVARHVEERYEPGRPRPAFSAGAVGKRSYRLLAEILVSFVSGTMPDAVTAATEAGRTWGHTRPSDRRPTGGPMKEEPVSELQDLGDIGLFRAGPVGQHREIWLRHCPSGRCRGAPRCRVCGPFGPNAGCAGRDVIPAHRGSPLSRSWSHRCA